MPLAEPAIAWSERAPRRLDEDGAALDRNAAVRSSVGVSSVSTSGSGATSGQASASSPVEGVLTKLASVCRARGLERLSTRLMDLGTLVLPDIEQIERAVAAIGFPGDRVGMSASHLVRLGGKRLRPVCVALAARTGDAAAGAGADRNAALHLAVAVELVHDATLLHDDVVDVGDVRRGAAAARVVYGNAASIFAGDWLLVEALRRVRASGVARVLDPLLGVIDQMIEAEALQLELRGRLDVDHATYQRVTAGKTAALFAWATYAGGRAAGVDDVRCEALSTFGRKLGLAFQAIDDLLDVSGDARATGKALFADLREGKATYPLIVAMEREPSLRDRMRALIGAAEAGESVETECLDVRAAMERTGAIAACAELAERSAKGAIDALDVLPESPAREALRTVAEATVHRLW